MDAIHINVTGARQAGIRFDEFPDVLYAELQAEITSLATELYGLVEAAVPKRTGKLAGQVRLRIFTDKTRITGYVDVAGVKGSQDFAKAAALEYGAHRPTKVAGHQMKLDHYWSHKLAEPASVVVAAYNRTANVMERAFERGPLAAIAPQAVGRLNAVVETAVAKANA